MFCSFLVAVMFEMMRMFWGAMPVTKKMDAFFQILKGVDQDEQSNTDRQQRVDQGKIGESHDDGTNENGCPSQYILQHVQADGFLIQRISAMGEIYGAEVDTDTNNGEEEHTFVVDFYRVKEPADRFADDQNGSTQKDRRHEDAAVKRRTAVFLRAFLFEEIGDADAEGIPHIVQGVGKDGDTSSQKTAEAFKNGKCQIQDKGNKDTIF